jgi:hypothetical protein
MMKFERNDDGEGFLSDDYGNSILLSDEQISAMDEMSGPERLDYIIEYVRDPLRDAQTEIEVKKTRDPQLAKTPLQILEDWTQRKGMARVLGKLNFDEDEDEIDDDDDEEREIAEGAEDDEN